MRLEIAWIVAVLSAPFRVASFVTPVTRRATMETTKTTSALYETASSTVSLETMSANLENTWNEAQVTKVCKSQGRTDSNKSSWTDCHFSHQQGRSHVGHAL